MISKTVTVHDVQTKLPELLRFASEGNEIIIVKNDKPLARLTPISPFRRPRVAGLNKGEIWVSEDFDAPLPDDFWTGAK